MIGGIVEIDQAGRRLSLDRGCLQVEADGQIIGRVALNAVEVLILGGLGSTISSPLLAAIAEQGGITVICGPRFRPTGIVLPLEGVGNGPSRSHMPASRSKSGSGN